MLKDKRYTRVRGKVVPGLTKAAKAAMEKKVLKKCIFADVGPGTETQEG